MFSWIEELEEMHKKMQNECNTEIPTYLPIYFLYYDSQTREINKIKKKRAISVDGEASVEEILRVIHHVCHRNSRAKIHDIFFYDNKTKSIQSIPILENIKLSSELFIFHDINSIFILMQCCSGHFIHKYTERYHTALRGGKHTRSASTRKITTDSI